MAGYRLPGSRAVVLLIIGFVVQGEPPDLSDDSAREIVDFYTDNKDALFVGAALQAVCAHVPAASSPRTWRG